MQCFETRDPADPGLGPVWVEVKTRLRVGPAKPGRPGGSTRNPVDPGKPWCDPAVFSYIYISKTPPLQTF